MGLHETILTLRHLLMLHSLKLTVLVAVYIVSLHIMTHRTYVRNGSAVGRPWRQYKLVYLGMVSIMLLAGFSGQLGMRQYHHEMGYLLFFLIGYPFCIFTLTAVAVSAAA